APPAIITSASSFWIIPSAYPITSFPLALPLLSVMACPLTPSSIAISPLPPRLQRRRERRDGDRARGQRARHHAEQRQCERERRDGICAGDDPKRRRGRDDRGRG